MVTPVSSMVGVASHELLKSNLDAMAGFLLSQVDGRTPVSQLLQLSGQPRFDALEALYRLKSKGLIRAEFLEALSVRREAPHNFLSFH